MKKLPSKSCPLHYGTGKIQEDAMKLFESGLHDFWGFRNTGWSITSLSVTASKIFDIPSGTNSILRYMKGPSSCASAIVDASSTPEETPSLDNELYVKPVHEEQFEPSSSRKEDCDSSNLAKHYSAIGEKGVPKKLSKVKGACSILKFLSQSQSALHEKRKPDSLICSHQGHESSSESNKAEEHDRSTHAVDTNNISSPGNQSAGSTWMFNVEDIDPAVVGELPPEIEREIRGGFVLRSMQAQKNGVPPFCLTFHQLGHESC